MDLKEKIAIIHNLIRVNKFTQAIQNCHKLIKLNPNVSYLYNLCGMAYQGNKQISKSIESLADSDSLPSISFPVFIFLMVPSLLNNDEASLIEILSFRGTLKTIFVLCELKFPPVISRNNRWKF